MNAFPRCLQLLYVYGVPMVYKTGSDLLEWSFRQLWAYWELNLGPLAKAAFNCRHKHISHIPIFLK